MKHVLLCGGAGTRLWPLSHAAEPKQMLRLFNERSLLQETLLRNKAFCDEVLIIANNTLYEKIDSQVREVTDSHSIRWIREPKARNTAAAVAMAALSFEADDILLVTPSDHMIGAGDAYCATIEAAGRLAGQGYLVTIGLKPAYPETGFGYIHYDGIDVIEFTEKPDLETAASFVASGRYLWNSGIFCFKASVIIAELKQHAPAILEACEAAIAELRSNGAVSVDAMEAIPSVSIDYAVMEKSDKIKVVASAMDWNDVGTYESLVEVLKGEKQDAININCAAEQNFVFSQQRPVAIVGLEDIIVVDRPNGLLIMKKGLGQFVKNVHQEVASQFPDAV